MSITEIKGTITDDQGKQTEFMLTADLGWQQWGERTEVLGTRVYLLDALAEAADGHMGDFDV